MGWRKSQSWVSELEKADVLINLSGRSVNCRYNSANRREIMESRTQSTLFLERRSIGLLILRALDERQHGDHLSPRT